MTCPNTSACLCNTCTWGLLWDLGASPEAAPTVARPVAGPVAGARLRLGGRGCWAQRDPQRGPGLAPCPPAWLVVCQAVGLQLLGGLRVAFLVGGWLLPLR